METSYKEKLQNSKIPADEIALVLKSTATLLRRHSNDGTLCPSCGNDDQAKFTVTKVDQLGFITEVRCEDCKPKVILSSE